MPGGLFFPPPSLKATSSDMRYIEQNRVLAAIVPLAVMLVLVVVCLVCAEWCGKRNRTRRRKQDSSTERLAYREPYRNPPDPNKFPYYAAERVLRTPTGSDKESTLSFDYMNYSFEYNKQKDNPINALSEIETTYEAPKESPLVSILDSFEKVKDTPPVMFEMDDQLADVSRSPSPTTLIREGKEMRYGPWLRSRESSCSSSASDPDMMTGIFSLSFDPKESVWLTEEEKQAKEAKRQLREKRRLKREKMEDEAEHIRQQINWTVQDDIDQKKREARAIDIPPRKRIEEHPQYQKMAMAMFDVRNAGFDATTVLNSAWEKGRMEAFFRDNMGYQPTDEPEDFSTLRDDVEIEPLRNEPERRQKPRRISQANEDSCQHQGDRRRDSHKAKGKDSSHQFGFYETKDVTAGEFSTESAQFEHQGARRKIRPEAKGKEAPSDQSGLHETKDVSVAECSIESSQGARRKVRPEAKGKDSSDQSGFHETKEVSATESSRSRHQRARRKARLEAKRKEDELLDQYRFYEIMALPDNVYTTESSRFQPRSPRRKVRSEPRRKEAAADQSGFHETKDVSVAEHSMESSQIQHQGARRKVRPETKGKESDQSGFHETKDVPVTERSTESTLFEHQGARRKVLAPKKSEAAADESQSMLLQYEAGLPSETAAKGKTVRFREHVIVKKFVPGSEISQQPGKILEGPVTTQGKKLDAHNSQPLFHHYGSGKNYGTMVQELRPMGVFTKSMMDTRVPLVVGKEYEERRQEESKRVSSKIAKAVFDIEIKRLAQLLIESGLASTVEVHAPDEPSSELGSRRLSPVEKSTKDVVVEVHAPDEPSSSELVKRLPSPVEKFEKDVIVEVHAPDEPSSSELVKREPSPVEQVEDLVIDLGLEDTTSSWEDMSPLRKYIWWPGIGDAKKKGEKKKKYGKRRF